MSSNINWSYMAISSLTILIRPCDLDLWPWKWIGFTLLRTKYVPSLVKIHWRMLILVFTRMLHSKNLTRWPWSWSRSLTIFQVFLWNFSFSQFIPSMQTRHVLIKDHPIDFQDQDQGHRVKFLLDVDSCSQGCYRVKIRPWPRPLTLKMNRVSDSPKD
jgi:hypothetical protein